MAWRGVMLELFMFMCYWAVDTAQYTSSSSYPNSSWFSDGYLADLYPSCTGTPWWIGDSICDERNNNPSCGYDGGDCCVCTSVAPIHTVFNCVDPAAPPVIYDCKEPQPIAPPCANDTVLEWMVEDTAGATALAEALNCSGGAFDVKWRGTVAIDRTIYVAGGTVLNVTGLGSAAIMDGNAAHRLFTVIGASLNIENMELSRGNASAGGAIAAAASRVALRNTSFIGNYAASHGGALYIIDSSTVSGGGETTFLENNVLSSGGAVYVDGASSVFWEGEASFFSNSKGTVTFWNNTCGKNGGALSVNGGSTASWSTAVTFENNSILWYGGGYGGALSVDSGSTVSWQAETEFSGNFVNGLGGALYVSNGSTVSSEAEVLFDTNLAFTGGGAVFVGYNCSLTWHERTEFRNNYALTDGGGLGSSLSVTGESPSSLTFTGDTSFVNNIAEENGGGLVVTGSLKFYASGTADMTFSGNSGGIAGGAVFVTGAGMGPRFVNMSFVGNSAKIGGGVYATQSGTTDTKNEASETVSHPTMFVGCAFIDNVAETTGGAAESDAGRTGFVKTMFKGNRARTGGALSLAGRAGLDNFSFIENISEEDGGPAVSNTAVLSNRTDNSFENNGFWCGMQKFLDFKDAEVSTSHILLPYKRDE